MNKLRIFFLVFALSTSAFALDENSEIVLEKDERLITILATNDMHGNVEPSIDRNKRVVGGLAFFGGVVDAIRQGLSNRFGNKAGVALVDGGDQFQGTLISNYTEGSLVFKLFSTIGYDAVVPGNHDYDFGPIGWLEDKVTPETVDKNPRGALQKALTEASFSLLSANTYLRSQKSISLDQPCIPGERPSYVKPYLIKEIAGVKTAFIGLDAKDTAKATAIENVQDLCFRDELETYLKIYRELKNKADVFVLVIHEGNIRGSNPVNDLTNAILESAGENSLHAVVSAHTHQVVNQKIKSVPIIQSGSSGDAFGRIDLVFDASQRKVLKAKTRSFAGVQLYHQQCVESVKEFCKVKDGITTYEGVTTEPKPEISVLIERSKQELAPLASRRLGYADGVIRRNRTQESPLANALTDVFREITHADVAMLNASGIRDDIDAGEITYSKFFNVIPFNNRAVTLRLPVLKLISILERSMRTCGSYGALMQSGLRIVFEKNCSNQEPDKKARLIRVATVDGTVILDVEKGIRPDESVMINVATLDFLATGTSGYEEFAGIQIDSDLGIMRELLVTEYLVNPANLKPTIDGRWKEIKTSEGMN